ncbi:MAG: chemotaxis protein CheD [Desulfovibrionaceae bacterium]|jgi:chemotaxis protein CheD
MKNKVSCTANKYAIGPEFTGPDELMRLGERIEHLKIGECIFTRKNVLVSTVLGSCVSLTFYHRETGASGMFHSMLPDSSLAKNIRQECNYVNLAVTNILERFKRLGIPPTALEVKLFGGGNTLQAKEKYAVQEDLDIGRKNVEAARLAIASRSMRIINEDVQGGKGRKVVFYTRTGEVWVRYISSAQSGEDA